uniref:R13L1/DRL21-like LRR repeat region domain-containing protein n=1 Tax=Aegilops tauschii subsp. strangulata TaxID=200361 RepID=A0A453LAE7_AEGTS
MKWKYNWRAELKEKEDQTEVLEGLCPPKHLESLAIHCYHGLRYPSWMMGKQAQWWPKVSEVLNTLNLYSCSTELGGFCPHLRSLYMYGCSWDTLPDHMESLTSLKDLEISYCPNILSLPTLPQSLEHFRLNGCNEMLMSWCTTVGDPNWEKLQHVPSYPACRLRIRLYRRLPRLCWGVLGAALAGGAAAAVMGGHRRGRHPTSPPARALADLILDGARRRRAAGKDGQPWAHMNR